MKLGVALFAALIVIFAACFAYPLQQIAVRLRVVYLESAEDPLADAANVLAAFVGHDAENTQALSEIFDDVYSRELQAQIYGLLKDHVDLEVYITDKNGIVVFDAANPSEVGKDYSSWRDVHLTLQGRYGARVARYSEALADASELFVAAPIYVHGAIAGVLTVGKPTTNIEVLQETVRPRLLKIGAVSAAIAIVLGFFVSLWVTREVGRLKNYAEDVAAGRRVAFPHLAPTELRTMGQAFERMRESLAGHAYITQYVQTLTHEIKSPLSAIRGATEILESDSLPPNERAKFLGNVDIEAKRIQDLIERMLDLAELEVRRALPKHDRVELAPILRTIAEAKAPQAANKALHIEVNAKDATVLGDAFLLHLAIANLVQNAIDFSPPKTTITLACAASDKVLITVEDQGPGIPDYAQARIFDKFFSLARPDTGKKSTGLGLNFVKEVATLHHGEIQIRNRSQGLQAALTLPLA